MALGHTRTQIEDLTEASEQQMWTKYRLYKDDDNHNMVIWESVTDTDFVGVGVDHLFKNSKQLYI